MDSTKEKLELDNGITLGETMVYVGTYQLTKDEVRTAFFGTVDNIYCHCAIKSCETDGCGDRFDVERNNGAVAIGCVEFEPDHVEVVKKWLDGK